MDNVKLTPKKDEISNEIRYSWNCGWQQIGRLDYGKFDDTLRTILQAYGDSTNRRFQLFVGDCSIEGSIYFTIDRFDGIKPIYRANVQVTGVFDLE